jgi:hypothetical protein
MPASRDHATILAHVEVNILAALGKRAVERPRGTVRDEQPHDIALAPLPGQRVEHSFEWCEQDAS